MRIWIVTVGEPLPIDSENERLLRAGILVDILVNRRHEVVWWTSTFDHVRKKQRYTSNQTVSVNSSFTIKFLYGKTYRKNISVDRIVNHRQIAQQFQKCASLEVKPNVILCSYPTIELCYSVVDYGIEQKVPVVVDIRDLWPDVYWDNIPLMFKPFIIPFFKSQKRMAHYVFNHSKAICGITHEFVNWGLNYAGRKKKVSDKVFYMAYSMQKQKNESLETVHFYWKKNNIDASQFIVCFFGNVGTTIELDTVIRAAVELKKMKIPIRFVICGSGPAYRHYQKKSAKVNTMVFPGWVGKVEIKQLMQISSFGLVPYRNVTNYILNLPNKPIEYLAGGLPILSSLQSGVIKNLIDHYSCGKSYKNYQDLVMLCKEHYHNQDLLKTLAYNAKNLYTKHFVAEKVYTSMAEYLEGIRW